MSVCVRVSVVCAHVCAYVCVHACFRVRVCVRMGVRARMVVGVWTSKTRRCIRRHSFVLQLTTETGTTPYSLRSKQDLEARKVTCLCFLLPSLFLHSDHSRQREMQESKRERESERKRETKREREEKWWWW